MRSFVMSVGLMIASLPVTPAAGFDPIELYGSRLAFDVLRDEEVVGEHVTTFQELANGFTVQSHMTLRIGVLFIPLYDFSYHSSERWDANQLSTIEVHVDDGGKRLDFSGIRVQSSFRSSSWKSGQAVSGEFYSTNHWHPGVVGKQERKVLNTLTGNINTVTIHKGAAEAVPVRGGTIKAIRYDYSGQLHDTSSWYDKSGRWVKLRFKARDGSTIEYVCRTCKPEAPT